MMHADPEMIDAIKNGEVLIAEGRKAKDKGNNMKAFDKYRDGLQIFLGNMELLKRQGLKQLS